MTVVICAMEKVATIVALKKMTTKNEIIRIPSTADKSLWCRRYLERTGGLGKRGEFDGNNLQQLMGLQAQIIVSDWLGLPRPEPSEGFDGGYDLVYQGLRYDVKCELRTVDFKVSKFVHNLCGNQLRYGVDRYVFVSYNRTSGIFEVCGWIDKNDALKYGEFYLQGTNRERTDGTSFKVVASGGLLEVDNYYLQPMRLLK